MNDINKQLDTIIGQNKIVIHELQAKNRDNRLWDRSDIADYCNLAPGTVTKFIFTRDSFPKPIRMAGIGPRWRAQEVKDWVGRQRGERLTRDDSVAHPVGRPRKAT